MKALLSDVLSFLRSLVYIVVAGTFGYYALTMILLGWPTRILLVVSVASLAFVAVRLHEKHHRSERFDDKLSSGRMAESTEWIVNLFKGGDANVED